MEYTFAQYQESAQALRDRLGAFRPRCLLILGSGLGSLGNEVESPIAVPYEDVPHMKRSTAPDHAGRFVFGRLAGQDVAVMQGRLHTYEGWSFEDVSYPVRVLRLLGAETLVVMVYIIRARLTVDRIIGINLTGTLVAIIIAILAYLLGEDYLVDVAIVYVVLSFIAVMLLCRIYINLYQYKRQDKREDESHDR